MKVETIHPITGIKKVVYMTRDEYEAMKILSPVTTRIVQDDETPVSGSPVMPSNDSDYWDEQKAFFKRYE